MDRRSKLVAVALLVACAPSFAAFITPAAPAGVSGLGGGGTFTPAGPTPLEGLLQRAPFARVPGPVLPGAPQTTAALRFGGGAARVLAGRVIGGAIPIVGVGLGIAWLAENCVEKKNGQWGFTCLPGEKPPAPSAGETWRVYGAIIGPFAATRTAACEVANATWNTYAINNLHYKGGRLQYVSGNVCATYVTLASGAEQGGGTITLLLGPCATGWYVTSAGCVQTPSFEPATQQQIEDRMADKSLPPVVPQGVPYPLDPQAPFIFNPDSATPPNAQPLRAPQGLPQPVPNTNPQQYQQPVTRFVPAPTLGEPTRLDAQPETITSTSPTGITSPQTPSPGSTDGKPPEQFDLCKEHPDIIACQVFKPDELTEKPLVNKEVPLALNAEGGFPSGGSCPQPKTVQLMGKTFAFSMQPLCDFALGIKPLLIGFAWLSAALVFLGVARREN